MVWCGVGHLLHSLSSAFHQFNLLSLLPGSTTKHNRPRALPFPFLFHSPFSRPLISTTMERIPAHCIHVLFEHQSSPSCRHCAAGSIHYYLKTPSSPSSMALDDLGTRTTTASSMKSVFVFVAGVVIPPARCIKLKPMLDIAAQTENGIKNLPLEHIRF